MISVNSHKQSQQNQRKNHSTEIEREASSKRCFSLMFSWLSLFNTSAKRKVAPEVKYKPIFMVEQSVVQQKMWKKQQENGISNNVFRGGYGLLIEKNPSEWLIVEKGIYRKPNGKYAFVTMLNGDIRLWKLPNGHTYHKFLADFAEAVRYAGEIDFDSGLWNNQCSTYGPSKELAVQAGLPIENFRDYTKHVFSANNSNDCIEEQSDDKEAIDGYCFESITTFLSLQATSTHHHR